MHLKMSLGKWQLFWSGLSLLVDNGRHMTCYLGIKDRRTLQMGVKKGYYRDCRHIINFEFGHKNLQWYKSKLSQWIKIKN